MRAITCPHGDLTKWQHSEVAAIPLHRRPPVGSQLSPHPSAPIEKGGGGGGARLRKGEVFAANFTFWQQASKPGKLEEDSVRLPDVVCPSCHGGELPHRQPPAAAAPATARPTLPHLALAAFGQQASSLSEPRDLRDTRLSMVALTRNTC